MKSSESEGKCHVLFSRPEPVLWSKDGGELPDIERMIMEGTELTFTMLNKTDNGTYRCEASNDLGTGSAEYILFVYGEYGDSCSCYWRFERLRGTLCSLQTYRAGRWSRSLTFGLTFFCTMNLWGTFKESSFNDKFYDK